MAVLSFSNGDVLIDDADLQLIEGYSWCVWNAESGLQYAAQKNPWVSMHRVILGAPEGVFVDHRNGNGLDNRRQNLRLATIVQNSANRRKSARPMSSRFKGVSFNKREQRWVASIGVSRRRFFLGYFCNEEDAARAYNARAVIEFGEFARLNVL